MATTENGIYYPNDGKKAADVLADLKAMAESIDKNIQENKFDDKDVKKDISDIKKEQQTQNSDIENLQTNDNKQDELISKLKNALINAETEEEKSIYVEDASTIGSLEILGNHEQKTREGYNILNLGTFNQKTSNGMTCSQVNNSSVKFNGTTSAISNFWFNDLGITLSAGTYKFKLNESISGIAYALKDSEGANILQTALSEETITLAEEKTFNQLLIQVNENMNLTNKEINLMIYKGTEEKPYEQYGASPSPDYPSKIKCLGSNENIFDKDNVNKLNAYIATGNTLIVSESGGRTLYIPCKSNSSYTIQKKPSRLAVGYTKVLPEVGGRVYDVVSGVHDVTTNISYTTGEDAKYLVVFYYNTNNVNYTEQEILDSIKIEKGTEATSYSSFRTR